MKKVKLLFIIAFIPRIIFGQINNEECLYCKGNTVNLTNGASAMGTNNISTGINSLASGFENEATGNYSFAVGYQNIAFGSHSIAMGKTATAYGIQSLAIGLLSEALGNASMAVGAYTKTTEAALLSIAFGSRVTAAAERSMTIGFGISDNPIVNIVNNSLMIGFESNLPTLFIGPSGGMGKTGKVGIGNVTSPTAKLHIRADAGDSATLRLEPGSGKVSRMYFSNSNDYYIQAANNQNMVFNTLTGNHYVFQNGNIRSVNGTALTPAYSFSANSNSGMYLPTTNAIAFSTAGAERVRITNTGNVGIGVTSPIEKIEVAGFAKTTSGYKVGSSIVINATKDYTGGSGTFNGIFTVTGTGNSSFAGNVGIGTSPTEKLEVAGWVKTSNGYKVGTSPVIDINRNYSGNNGNFEGALAVTGTSTLNGNVGIGTSPNSNKLTVSGTVQATSFLGNGAGLTNVPGDNLGDHIARQNIQLTGKWLSGDGGDEGLFINNDGKVGIGTAIPNEKLDILGYARTSDGFKVGSNTVINSDSDHNGRNGTFSGTLNVTGSDNSTFSGNLGIGTTPTTGYKLAVAGKIHAEEVMVEHADDWYDFVFENNYQLPDLSELESYVRQNKHLPDVPSAKEVAENGINLGEMNGILLKKVEELTLYIIEQQKEIEKLKEAITK